MRQFIFFTLICLLLNISCKDSSAEKAEETMVQSENAKAISAKVIESLKFNDYALSEDASKALGQNIRNWINR